MTFVWIDDEERIHYAGGSNEVVLARAQEEGLVQLSITPEEYFLIEHVIMEERLRYPKLSDLGISLSPH